jgi:hypothetical protein
MDQPLEERVRARLVEEFGAFGLLDLALRVDGTGPARSVLAVARLRDGEAMAVARVYERDLDSGQELHVVFLASEDVALLASLLGVSRAWA